MKVLFSPVAEHDLVSLTKYIREDLQNPIAAHNIAEKLLRLSYELKNFPEMGVSLGAVEAKLSSYRYLLTDNYIVIYKLAEQEVRIIRILYARSDYVRLLLG